MCPLEKGLLFFMFLTFNHAFLLACSCGPTPSVMEGLKGSVAVFSGEAILIEGDYIKGYKTTFRVDKVWKGKSLINDEIVLKTRNPDSCGYSFQTGEKYLVYTYLTGNGSFSTSFCSRTSRIKNAQEDINELSRSGKKSKVKVKENSLVIEGYSPFTPDGQILSYKAHNNGKDENKLKPSDETAWLACNQNSDCTSMMLGCYYWQPVNKKYVRAMKKKYPLECRRSIPPGPQPSVSCSDHACVNNPFTGKFWNQLGEYKRREFIGKRIDECIQEAKKNKWYSKLEGTLDYATVSAPFKKIDDIIKNDPSYADKPLDTVIELLVPCEEVVKRPD